MADENPEQIFYKYQCIVTEEKLQKIKDVDLSELGYLIKNIDSFISSSKKDNALPKLVELIVSFGLVDKFEAERDYESRDFPYVSGNAEICFTYLNCLLNEYEALNTSSKRKFLVQVLLLCATHSSNYCWSSEKSVQLSNEFIGSLLSHSKHENLSHLLCDDVFHPTIFKCILRWLRPFLMKDTWFKYPSACYIFYWILSHVKHPHLVDYMNDIFPPAFMFSSFYNVPQQVIGIKCFDHILDNVPPSLVKADGTSEAIYHALKNFTYLKELPIVEVLYPCLLKLPGMDQQKENQLNWSVYDEVLRQLLLNLDYEYNLRLRFVFLSHLLLYIKVVPCFKHLKLILTIILRNLSGNVVVDEECTEISLKILQHIIKSCWPRMDYHCFEIVLAILKIIYDVENDAVAEDDNSAKEVLNLCEENLFLLRKACPETFMKLVDEYLEEDSVIGAKQLKCVLSRED